MIIANPIYDVVFKSLMDDLEIARGLISNLIGQDVVEIQTRSNDAAIRIDDAVHAVTVYRLDYVAVVRLPDGGERRILVEVQKARLGSEVRRFRDYLGKQYMTPAYMTGPRNERIPYDPPIVTIYILGFNLDPAIPPYAKVDRRIMNVLTGSEVACREEFIESLTHDMYILQAQRVSHEARTDLERLLAIFAQTDFEAEDSHRTINVPDALTRAKSVLFKRILRHLRKLAADRQTRSEMEREDRSYAEFELIVLKRQLEMQTQIEEERRQKEVAEQAAEEERRLKEEERRLKEIAEQAAEAERRQKEDALAKLNAAVDVLVGLGKSPEDARRSLGLE